MPRYIIKEIKLMRILLIKFGTLNLISETKAIVLKVIISKILRIKFTRNKEII